MKFPRNARIFRGQLDAAPFAAVFFLLVIFAVLTTVVYTPGVHIDLPAAPAADIAGVAGPTVAVAVDRLGRFYFKNRPVTGNDLKRALAEEVKKSGRPLTVVLMEDKEATEGVGISLMGLVRGEGITNIVLQTLPPPFAAKGPKP